MRILILIIATFFVLEVNSQDRDIHNLQHEKRHEIAHDLVNKGSYYNAIDHLERLALEHPKNRKYVFRLAEAYFFSRDYVNAEKWLKKAIELDPKQTTAAQFRYAECLKYNAKYSEAKVNFKEFLEGKYKDSRGQKFKLYADQEIKSCDWAIAHQNEKGTLPIIHLSDSVNSAYSDFSPYQLNDSTLIFASIQADSVLTYSFEEMHFHHTKLYKVSMTDSFTFKNLQQIDKANSTFENNANGSLSPDGKQFYFSRCYENLKHHVICNLYVCEVDEKGNLGKPNKLPHPVNKANATNTQPFVAQHKTDKGIQKVLYFSSNRNGGKGGLDLWASIINPDGSYKSPLNLGANINSARDEVTPYFDEPTGLLYFSSNYHNGFGGYDIFASKGMLNNWTEPLNIGAPFNTSVDDIYFNYGKKNKGFLVSNRVGGHNLKSPTCCDDIYAFQEPRYQLLLVHTYNKENNALYLGANEKITTNNELLRPLDKEKYYFLYDQLTENEIYLVEKNKNYDLKIVDSSKVTLAYFSTEMTDKFAVTLFEKEDSHDSISITNVTHPRFDIHVINLFKSFKDIEIARALVQKRLSDSIANIQIQKEVPKKDTLILTSKPDTLPTISTINQVKDTLVIAKKTTDSSLITKQIIPIQETKIARQDSTTTLKTKDIKQTFIEKKVTKIHKYKNVKRCVVYDNKMAEVSTIEKSEKIDSSVSSLETSYLKIKNKNEPDIKMVVHYGYNEDQFIADHKVMLDSIARFLIQHPHITLDIEAHTDNVGSEQYNIDLSYKRAKTLANYFAHIGIPRERLNTKWFGEHQPAVPNQNSDGSDNATNRHQNRRAELKFYGVKKKTTK